MKQKAISTKDRLPKAGQYVLARFPDRPWIDQDSPNLDHKWVVVKLILGISKADRDKLPDSDKRKRIYTAGDEWGNNLRPYCWKTFGEGIFKGQEADYWCDLPEV